MKAIDPTLQSIISTYGDTDSMHIYGKDYKKLLALGYIKDKCDSQLGYLNNDIDLNALITYEKNLAPKAYRYEYVDENGKIYDKDVGVTKMKGIPHKHLKAEYYDGKSHEI